METFSLALLLLAAVLVSSILDQFVSRVSLPLIQIALGLLIALFAVSPFEITMDPNLFLVLFVAPLLFHEGKTLDKEALWKNKRPVLSLAIGLVIATTLVIGFSLNWLMPSIPLAAAFALGAAISPTDAVAVSSLSKEVNIERNQKNVLEAESLLNDASGVVSFQFALAAAVTGTFSILDASVGFVFTFIGGILIGLALAWLANFVIKKVRATGIDNTTFHVLFELCLPFVIYLVANSLGVSGILAVVVAGLSINAGPKKELGPSISRLNIVSTSVWQVFAFTLNGIVFVLLGALLPSQMADAWNSQTSNYLLIGEILIITFLMMLVRFMWILIMEFRMRRKQKVKSKRSDLRVALVNTCSGAKGAITLSVMMSIPLMISTGTGIETFPQRNMLIFIASGVIILSLLIANFVVPLLAPKKTEDQKSGTVEERTTVLEIFRNVIEELTAIQTPENRFATQTVIKTYNERIANLKDSSEEETQHKKDLRIQALRWEQDFVLELIENEEIEAVDGYKYLNRLAHVQNLIRHEGGNIWTLRKIFRHPIRILMSIARRLRRLNPKQNAVEREKMMRETQIRATEYVIGRLQTELIDPDIPTEDVSALIYEYQQISKRLKNPRLNVGAITKSAQEADEVTRLGLNLELEQIQMMYEDDRLSRTTAKRLRENVYLMQIDLEDRI